ncbi:MAG TPA: glycosyltransferase [Pyrinomonadaceae bacterium]|nr:glycosyltransferase [Pyrinomonadaceae bacterium]
MSENSERPRILVAGDGAVPTGFARVMEGVFAPLAGAYEIHQIATNYRGDPHGYSWKLYPAETGGDRWGAGRLLPLIEKIKPRLVFVLNDIWVQHAYLNELRKMKDAPPVVLYCPVDGGPLDAEGVEPLRGVRRCVAYTEFGRGVIEAAVRLQRAKDPSFDFPAVEIIPHGVDTETFRPLEGEGVSPRLHARRLLFPNLTDLEGRFIVLNANRNQPRKRIDTTIRGFALFARDKPAGVNLFLHMGVEDVGWNVVMLTRRYGVEDRVLMSSLDKVMQTVSTRQLNLVYNACDVGLNTSSAEGWGLPSFEHAATRAAQVVPRHSACAELWEGSGVLVEPALKIINEKILTEGWLVTPEGVAGALEKLYADRGFLDEMSERAYRNATRDEYRWENIAARWDALFREVLAEPTPA